MEPTSIFCEVSNLAADHRLPGLQAADRGMGHLERGDHASAVRAERCVQLLDNTGIADGDRKLSGCGGAFVSCDFGDGFFGFADAIIRWPIW